VTGDGRVRITETTFLPRLFERVPESRDVYNEHLDGYGEFLLHLFMADLLRFAVSLFQAQEREILRRLLSFIEDCLVDGDVAINNAVAVSFVENVGAEPGETSEFIATWPRGLLAERDRQLSWSNRPRVGLAEFHQAFGDQSVGPVVGEVTDSSAADWQDLLDVLYLTQWQTSLGRANRAPAPRSASELEPGFIIRVMVGPDLRINFFDRGSIAFDFDVRQIREQRDINAVASLIELVGQAMHKSVRVSPKGSVGRDPALVYDFDTDTTECRVPRRPTN
jgi:hypothetical protein